MSGRATPRLLLLATAVLFSTGGAAIKATTLTSWQVACFRSGVAAAALTVLLPAARRGWERRIWPVGVAYAATLILYVLANKLTTAANAIFLQATAPLYLLLVGPLLLKERMRIGEMRFMVFAVAGMALFFVGTERAVATAPDPAAGNVLAAFSGVGFAFVIAGLRWIGKHGAGGPHSVAAVVAGNLMACAVCLPMALPVVRLTPGDAGTVLYLGVFQIGLAYLCLTRALRHVPALEASVLMLLEPVLNPVWAWLLHGERPSRWALAGGALILAATTLHTWWHTRSTGDRRNVPPRGGPSD
ncbi:MAG: EamA/RhaT family transporter [Acidobacteria bacterium]|nr:EamA/RhaT family transporter [Acidobacteriota bacterium]